MKVIVVNKKTGAERKISTAVQRGIFDGDTSVFVGKKLAKKPVSPSAEPGPTLRTGACWGGDTPRRGKYKAFYGGLLVG